MDTMMSRVRTPGRAAPHVLAYPIAALLIIAAVSGRAAAEEEEALSARPGVLSFLGPLDALESWVEERQKQVEDASGFKVSGFLDKSYMWNFNDPDSGVHTLHSLDPDHDSPDLDLFQLRIDRNQQGWIPGFGSTLNFGRVARRMAADYDGDGAVGFTDGEETNSFEFQEGYLTYDVPVGSGLTLKAGKFVTLLGAEVIEAKSNYNFSRSFLFGLAIPFTHIGALASYPITDQINVTAGMVTGWDNVRDNNQAKSFMGNVTYAPCDFATIAFNMITGAEQTDQNGNDRTVFDLVTTIKPIDRVTLLLNYDYGDEENAALTGTTANWQGFSGIVNYDFTDRFSTALRGEWFQDDGGARTGASQRLWETTVSFKYLLTKHLYGRAEYRHDESSRDHIFEAGTGKATPGQDIVGFEFGWVF
jgi:hypothetical protein